MLTSENIHTKLIDGILIGQMNKLYRVDRITVSLFYGYILLEIVRVGERVAEEYSEFLFEL